MAPQIFLYLHNLLYIVKYIFFKINIFNIFYIFYILKKLYINAQDFFLLSTFIF